MKHKLSRFRRSAVALAVCGGTIGGVVVGAAGTAFASTTPTTTLGSGSTIAAVSAPTIASTGTNQAAGNLTITLATGTTINTGDTISLVVSASGTGSTVTWDAIPSVSTAGGSNDTVSVGAAGGTSSTLTLTLTPGATQPSTSAETITLSGISYNTTSATGTLSVVATLIAAAGTGNFPFSQGSGVANATLPATPPTAPSFTLTAASSPVIGLGQTSQAAGNFNVGIYGAGNSGWVQNNTVVIEADPNTGTNCSGGLSAPDTVGFSAIPTATVTSNTGDVSTAPTVSVALGQSAACSGTTIDNQIIVTFTNSGTLTNATGTTAAADSANITLTGVAYNIGSGFTPGSVSVTGAYAGTAITTPSATTSAPTGPSNATVGAVTVTANSPAVSVTDGAINSPISDVSIAEAKAGTIPGGTSGYVYVCVTLTSGSFNTSTSTPAVAASPTTSGSGTAASTASVLSTGGGSNNTVALHVTGTSTTSATTYTLSKLAVNVPAGTSPGGDFITVSYGQNSTCTSTAPTGTITGSTANNLAAFNVASATTVVAGSNADATAAAEFESQFPSASTGCPGHTGSFINGITAYRPVVLATDSNYPDALAASYLAGYLDTGILLTPPGSVSSATLSALQNDGITNVYVVGGPYVVSAADIAQLKATASYTCGGKSARTSLLGTAEDLTVTQIYGQTEYGTAMDIAEMPGASNVNSISVPGAYNGQYSVTTPAGTESAAPSTTLPLKTAILATGQGFQDAMSASALAYKVQLPILLTTPTVLSSDTTTALSDLGIQQVIVMGGPLAISNTVVKSLQGMRISVLRIAGQDYTGTAIEMANFLNNTGTSSTGVEGLDNTNAYLKSDLAATEWIPTTVNNIVVARGDFYTDGLAGSVITGRTSQPLLITENPTTVGQYLTAFLNQAGTVGIDSQGANFKVSSLTILGGPLAISTATISAMETALNG